MKSTQPQGSTPFRYPDEGEGEPNLDALRETQVKALEFMASMLLSARTDRVRHMRASICLAILKGQLNVGEIAEHFGVCAQRVRNCVKEIESLSRGH